MGVSLVRVGDSRVRGRGRGQGVPAINGHWPPSPTDTGETKTYNTTPPFCSYGKKQTNMHWRHFVSKNKETP